MNERLGMAISSMMSSMDDAGVSRCGRRVAYQGRAGDLFAAQGEQLGGDGDGDHFRLFAFDARHADGTAPPREGF